MGRNFVGPFRTQWALSLVRPPPPPPEENPATPLILAHIFRFFLKIWEFRGII